MAQTKPASSELPASKAARDSTEIKGWEPDDPAYFVSEDIPEFADHIRHSLAYSPRSNVGILFQQTERDMRLKLNNKRQDMETQPDPEDDAFWVETYQDTFILGMRLFFGKHMPQYLPQSKILAALCTSTSVKRAILSRVNANFSPESDEDTIFNKTMRAEFAKSWCEGYKLVSDIYYPLIEKILMIAEGNEKFIPLPKEVVERHLALLRRIPDDDPLCYL